jgi:hypothetical protein
LRLLFDLTNRSFVFQELNPDDISKADSYQHPAFKIDEGELTELLAEAEKAEELLAMPDYSPGLLVRRPIISKF